MTFSAGPRVRDFSLPTHTTLKYPTQKSNCQSCIGQRFSLIEMKTFLYTLITNFVFAETDEKVVKANVYVSLRCSSREMPLRLSRRQGTYETFSFTQIRGGESVSNDRNSL